MKVYFYTLGCKVNQYETQAMGEQFKKAGYEVTSNQNDADIFVVNSCTVTASGDQKSRQAVRRFKRNHPNSVVILTGCMPQAYPEQAKSLDCADIIIGNKSDDKIVLLLNEHLKNKNQIENIVLHKKGDGFDCLNISSFNERTRAFVKIQDGCDRFCSYCIIPTSRGRARSKPIDKLKHELNNIAQSGYKEVTLVGINLSFYGDGLGYNLYDAVKLACSFDSFKRVRLGSLEPDNISDKLIKNLATLDKFCPQFHISLQSGCDKTLKNMNRHYDSNEYYSLCKKLRNSFKDTTLTTDIMVGFPDETEEDFNNSIEFAKKVKFEKIHAFPYSVRPGTKAEKMSNHIQKSVKEERCKKLISVSNKIRLDFFKSQVGNTVEILCETFSDGFVYGYTKNYTPLKVRSNCDLHGELKKVKIIDFDDNYCVAELID